MSVNTYLSDSASNLVLSTKEKESITTSINTLEIRLESYFGANIEEKFKFGSYTRVTILPRKADEESDVDYMVVFDNSNNYTPQTFLDRLKICRNKIFYIRNLSIITNYSIRIE